MNRILIALSITTLLSVTASAQLLPNFQFGIKGGFNTTSLPKYASNNTGYSFYNNNGAIAGVWAKIGALGVYFQPEAYLTTKMLSYADNRRSDPCINCETVTDIAVTNKTKLTSVDVPLLVGTKIGALGFGVRFNTGPLVSFAIHKNQEYTSYNFKASAFEYKNQNYAWQFGAGVDLRRLSIDARYEAGLTKVYNSYGDNKRVNLFNFTLGYRLFSIL